MRCYQSLPGHGLESLHPRLGGGQLGVTKCKHVEDGLTRGVEWSVVVEVRVHEVHLSRGGGLPVPDVGQGP